MHTSTFPGWTAANDAERVPGAIGMPFDISGILEAQMRLWNHLLDANRSLLAFYMPWLEGSPWSWNQAQEPERADVREPEQTINGVPDAFELQARLWNHMLDANRSFWGAFTWSVPGAPWLPSADDRATDREHADASQPPSARRTATTVRRKAAGGR